MMSLYEYQGMIHHWLIAHAEKPVAPELDPDELEEMQAEAEAEFANWDSLVPLAG